MMKVNHNKNPSCNQQFLDILLFKYTILRKIEEKRLKSHRERERGGGGGKGIYATCRYVLYIYTCVNVTERFKRRYLTFMYMYAFLYNKSARLWNGCFIGQFTINKLGLNVLYLIGAVHTPTNTLLRKRQ